MSEGGPVRILVVCTANICRSPMAEYMLREAVEDLDLDVRVSSAGFLFDGEAASPKTIAVMADRGVDVAGHRTSIVDAELLADADLILTMERRHARELIVEHPAVADLVHTFGGLVDALADLEPPSELSPAERARLVVADRSSAQLFSNGPDEVADPHGRSRRRHKLAADRIAVLVDALLEGLFDVERSV